jgi:hypothetical protein
MENHTENKPKKSRKHVALVGAKAIYTYSKMADRFRKRENNLTIPFIEEMISHPCEYCGDDKSKLTLDRIDNDIGHIIGNVKTSCITCNWIKRDIPYDAWIIISKAINEARLLGLFGSWDLKKKIIESV